MYCTPSPAIDDPCGSSKTNRPRTWARSDTTHNNIFNHQMKEHRPIDRKACDLVSTELLELRSLRSYYNLKFLAKILP